eukprot:4210124-Alexandrium_andersonii.AAC.1
MLLARVAREAREQQAAARRGWPAPRGRQPTARAPRSSWSQSSEESAAKASSGAMTPAITP